jgi:hypothetical protein
MISRPAGHPAGLFLASAMAAGAIPEHAAPGAPAGPCGNVGLQSNGALRLLVVIDAPTSMCGAPAPD